MRIGTWNVEYAPDDRLGALRSMLSANPADIWILTETRDELAPGEGRFFAHADPRPGTFSSIRPGSRWVSIWSKFPIVERVTLPGADANRTVAAVLDLGGGGRLIVYGTVMPWHSDQGDLPPETRLPNWSEHHRVVEQQCAEWLKLQRLYPDASLCVAGDYNTDMGTGSLYGTKTGISALSEGLRHANLFCVTQPGRIPSGLLPALPIDHISLPISWAKSASVVAAWPASKGTISDHSGLIVEANVVG